MGIGPLKSITWIYANVYTEHGYRSFNSKATIAALSTVLPYPSYYQILHFIRRIKPTFNNIREDHDVITAFDNEQKL